MFLKFASSQNRSRFDVHPTRPQLSATDVAELRTRVHELEAEVERLTAKSNDLSEQLAQAQDEAKRHSGFSDAWSTREDDTERSRFFAQSHVDERARRWLLDS